MNTHQIIFTLSTTEAIVIDIFDDIHDLYPCDDVVIKFHNEFANYIIGKDFIREKLESFYNQLLDALDNKNQLHASITQDIGYLWNEKMQRKPGLTYMKLEDIDFWVGLQNLVWETPGNVKFPLTTWLYNDIQGSIILEITPDYFWHFVDPEANDKTYIPYEEWIKIYEPLLIRTIPRDIAITWKNQAKEILDLIQKNVEHANVRMHNHEK